MVRGKGVVALVCIGVAMAGCGTPEAPDPAAGNSSEPQGHLGSKAGPPPSEEEVADVLDRFVRGYVRAELMMPSSSEADLNSAARTLRARVDAMAPGGSVDVEGTGLVVGLPGFSDGPAVMDALLSDGVLRQALVSEVHSAEAPHQDFSGCQIPADDGRAWVCADDGEAYLVESAFAMGKPTGVKVDDSAVTVSLSADAATRFQELSAEAACRRDAGSNSQIAVFVGSRVVIAPTAAPGVACGEGITGGEFTMTVTDAAEAADLADLLRSSFDVVPNPSVVESVSFAVPWPRSGQLDTADYLMTVAMSVSDGSPLTGTVDLSLEDGAPAAAGADDTTLVFDLTVPRLIYEAAGLNDCVEPTSGSCHIASATLESPALTTGEVATEEITFEQADGRSVPWPAELLEMRITGPDGAVVNLDLSGGSSPTGKTP